LQDTDLQRHDGAAPTQVSSLASLYVLAVGYGLFFGGVSMSALLTVRSLVPTRIAGTAIGLVSLFGWVGMGLGGYLGGVFFDWSGSYVTSFAVATAAGVVNLAILAGLFMRLRRATRPRLDLEPAQAV
jgi:MFS family permease